jgi:hypothetical protein
MVAALHLYQSEGVACASSGADFSSGLMATAAAEGLAIVGLVERKASLKTSASYKRLWRQAQVRARDHGLVLKLSQFVLELRFDDLFRIAREVGLYDERGLPDQVEEVLKIYGYPDKLTHFVRKARNCIHPRWNLHANEMYANPFGIYYSLESMKQFHADFALCAWTLNERIANCLGSES